MQNVAKYAHASGVTVSIAADHGSLRFAVRDDGRGFDLAPGGEGTGIRGMRDRLAPLGGDLTVTSQAGGGTTVAGRLPVDDTGS